MKKSDHEKASAVLVGLGGFQVGDRVRILRGAYVDWIGELVSKQDATNYIWWGGPSWLVRVSRSVDIIYGEQDLSLA